jgi:membrane protein
MRNIVVDFLKKIRVVISETLTSFQRNKDLSAASSLSFSATLALIPSLFLLTFVLGAVIGSSERVMARTQDLLKQFIPAYSQDIMHEVQFISSHMGTIGALNLLVLLWSVTPLVADLRVSLGTVFRKKPSRPFLLEKLFDVAISIIFLMGLSTIVIAGVLFTLLEKRSHLHLVLEPFGQVVSFFFVTTVVFVLYRVFSHRPRPGHLFVGALATSLFWFAMRPLFHLFLMYNPGYGFAFGSFKSLFVVIIWIHVSLILFLLGAEIAASLGKDETIFIRHLMDGKRGVPAGVLEKYVVRHGRGSVIFNEGDPGNRMFSVLTGSVAIRKGEQEIAVIQAGKCFGGMSFLLSSPRLAMAVALEDVEVVVISSENIGNLMNEYPDVVLEIFREMAERIREINNTID